MPGLKAKTGKASMKQGPSTQRRKKAKTMKKNSGY
jgi:hypothetical protein